MVSQDYSGGQYPNAVNVRRFEGTGFGAPTTLAIDSSTSLFIGGAIAQSPERQPARGRLAGRAVRWRLT